MTLHPKKTRLYPLSEGVPFLGFRFKLTSTGRVLMLIDPKNVKAERKKLARLVAKSRAGELDPERVHASYKGWRAHAEKGNTWKLLHRMDAYYKSLWEGEHG